MDYTKKLSNVSFGGDWSEELVAAQKLNDLLLNLDWAVEHCTTRDVYTEGVREVLAYVKAHIEKGPMLVDRFLRGLKIEDQNLRQKHLGESVKLIAQWAGV